MGDNQASVRALCSGVNSHYYLHHFLRYLNSIRHLKAIFKVSNKQVLKILGIFQASTLRTSEWLVHGHT